MKKKVERKFNYEFIHYSFDSIWSLVSYLKSAPNNKSFKKYCSETGDFDFTGTSSYSEAEQLCSTGGDMSDFEKFMGLKEKLDDSFIEKQTKMVQFNDFIGEVPNVPLYLQGYPLNMIRQEKQEFTEDKIIDIYFNISCPGYTSKNQIYNRGIIALSLIDYLESLGFKVNLHLFELSTSGDQLILYEFNLKEVDEPLDYRTLFFPLTHPSFLRRIIFKLLEKTPEAASYWQDGYGRPASQSLVEKVFNISEGNKIIINDPTEMGIRGDNLEEDMERCISSIGMKDKIEEARNNPGNKR